MRPGLINLEVSDGNDDRQAERCEEPQGQRESMLLSRQPRACKASVLCISLWRLSPNGLVSICAAVDQQPCGKVDNSSQPALPRRKASAIHKQREVSTVSL